MSFRHIMTRTSQQQQYKNNISGRYTICIMHLQTQNKVLPYTDLQLNLGQKFIYVSVKRYF